jgi:hypothetical protein
MPKPYPVKVKYPAIRAELIALVQEEQKELRNIFGGNDKELQQARLSLAMQRCHLRSQRLLGIVDSIESPTMQNIGANGSEAILTLAMHSYLEVMKKIIHTFNNALAISPESVPTRYIPALIDRVHIIKHGKQLYGTQWTIGEDGSPFMIEVDSPSLLESRRKKFNLKPLEQPRNLTNNGKKYAYEGSIVADINEVCRPMSIKEYASYVRYYKKSLLTTRE